MIYKGWIKLHRQFLDWEWYDDPNTLRLFLHCLLKANHKDKKYRGDLIKRTTFVTSLEVLAYELNLTSQQIRTSLGKLEKTGEINRKSNRKGTVITVCNYNTYQSDAQENNTQNNRRVTDEQQTSNTRATSTKNDKNLKTLKNEEKSIYPFESFWVDYDKEIEMMACQDKWNSIPDNDKAMIKDFIPIYKAHSPDNRFRKNPLKFLNSEIWRDNWKNYKPKDTNETSSDFYESLAEIEQLNEIHGSDDQEGASSVNIYQLPGR